MPPSLQTRAGASLDDAFAGRASESLPPTLLGKGDLRKDVPLPETLPGQGPGASASRTPAGYEILGELGRGGMGVVYKARQVKLNRLVALKMIRSGGHAEVEERLRFLAEAEVIASLRHPGIVQIHDFGTHQCLPFFALEFCPGGSLAGKLEGTPLPPREAAALVEQVARAMQAAHERGIVHRDLKPANILLDESGAPRVTDFGLARRGEGGGLTKTGTVMGTPSYMAPEQAQGKKAVGPPADVWALGAILYECLTGRPPFRGADSLEILGAVVHHEPARPSRLNPKAPYDLETVCLKCLEKDPKRRYPTAGDLADDLRRFLGREPIRARPVGALGRAVRWARRRPAALLAGLLAGLVLAGGAGGFGLWRRMDQERGRAAEARLAVQERERAEEEARRVRVAYYKQFDRRWGVPFGYQPLTMEQARRCRWMGKIYRRGGRVERLDVVNGSGALVGRFFGFDLPDRLDGTTGSRRESSYRYRYDSQGNLAEESARDQTGRLLWKLHYTSRTTAQYTDAQGFPDPRTGSGAAYVQYVWLPDGLAREIRYVDRLGRRKSDRNGIYGKRYEYTARGERRRVTYVDREGRPTVGPDRTASWTARYDERGARIEKAFFDAAGRPTLHRDGYHRWTSREDGNANPLERAFFGVDGKPTLHKEGYHLTTAKYDARGNATERAYYGVAGKPTVCKSGYHRRTERSDEHGRVVEMAFFGIDGKPARNSEGCHRWTRRYDEAGDIVGAASFGADGKPMLAGGNHAFWEAKYDGQGNRIESASFGATGKPTLRKEGYHVWQARYDARGNQLEVAYRGLDREPILRKEGYHRWLAKYDGAGNRIERTYLGIDGRPASIKSGYHRWAAEYDEHGREVQSAYFAVDGRPVNAPVWSRQRKEYGATGELVRTTLWKADTEGRLHLWQRKDGRGRVLESVHLTAAGRPGTWKQGHHRWTARYDWRGNRIEEASFAPDGKPMAPTWGYHRWTARYDERGRKLEQAFFGINGEPAFHADEGSFRFLHRYDARGNRTETLFLGPNGRAMNINSGWARRVSGYDEKGKLRETVFWRATHAGDLVRWKRPDAGGRLLGCVYLDPDGKAALDPDREFHRTARRYDSKGRLLEVGWFGPDGKPAVSGGVHRLKIRYDPDGGWEETSFASDGKPVLNRRGFHRMSVRFDRTKHRRVTAFFGTEGRAVRHARGFHRVVADLDASSRILRMRCEDLEGKPAASTDGYSRREFVHRGDLPGDTLAFDLEGKPVPLVAVVTSLLPGSLAEAAGLKKGDVLLTYRGRSFRSAAGFLGALRVTARETAFADVEVRRGGKSFAVRTAAGNLGVDLRDVAEPVALPGR
jgi:tRNA A-37 threonylcarbamoyl transferase component Bud32